MTFPTKAPMATDQFEPKLGRMHAPPAKRETRYLAKVLRSAGRSRAGPKRKGPRADCGRIGRGAGLGRLLGLGDPAGPRSRRAIVKTRLVRLRGRGVGGARAHLGYLQRDGVERDGSPGRLYSAAEDRSDGRAFLERCEGDRHQFRLIVSAEDGAEYSDLKPLIRRFMSQMEKDLGTRLDWVAVDHCDTARPHTHIMLRGRDELGHNLVISREYISRGMRERLAELVNLDLGPRQDWEIRQTLRREVSAERLTSIDRGLIRGMDRGGTISAGQRDPLRQALRAGRLKKLEALGLAEPLGGGRWKLADGIKDRLRRLGERGDIVRTMQRELKAHGIERSPSDRVMHLDGLAVTEIVGRVVARGLADELADRHYLLVDGIDGRAHHIDIGEGEAVEALPEGAIVRVRPSGAGPRASDRLVADIAEANGGYYSPDLHLGHDPEARPLFVQAHVRRLEALRRSGAKVERRGDGSWRIAPDHLEQVAAYEQRRARSAPAAVDLLSPVPLHELAERDGATWLDRELAGGGPELLRDAGFGRAVRAALAERRKWLVGQALGEDIEGRFTMRPGSLAALRQREMSAAAARLSSELGLNFAPSGEGERVEGVLRRKVDLASGSFALVEKGREFTLLPWRPLLGRQIGKEISAIARNGGIDWSIGRGRGGPELA